MVLPIHVQAKVKIPEDVPRDIVGFLKRLVGPIAEAADFLGDKIRYYRFASAMKTVVRAREINEQVGISPKEIPLKFLVPFLEDCSLEAEESPLIEQWAKLLSSASANFDPVHIAIREVLKNISAIDAGLIMYLGSQIQKEYFDDDTSSHNTIESSAGYVRDSIERYVGELKELPAENEVSYLMGDFIDGKPILPLYCQLPSGYLGVSQFLESKILHEKKGSLYLLERLEILKTLEYRRQYSSNPDFPEFIFSWLQFTPFGLEVYQHCVRDPVHKKRARAARKPRGQTRPNRIRKTPR